MTEPIRKVLLSLSEIQIDPEYTLIPEKIEALKNSMMNNGLINPIAVNEEYFVVSGHHRLMAILELSKDTDEFNTIPVRVVCKELCDLHIETTEKLFRPDLSILEKAESFKQYFEALKYGENKHKTIDIFKSLDISRRTFFNLRAIVECLSPESKEKVVALSHTGLPNSMSELLALSEYTHSMQTKLLGLMERESYQSIFEAIKSLDFSDVEQQLKKKKTKRLTSPSLKLNKDLRAELLQLSTRTGKSQHELFDEIFTAGIEVAQAKYL